MSHDEKSFNDMIEIFKVHETRFNLNTVRTNINLFVGFYHINLIQFWDRHGHEPRTLNSDTSLVVQLFVHGEYLDHCLTVNEATLLNQRVLISSLSKRLLPVFKCMLISICLFERLLMCGRKTCSNIPFRRWATCCCSQFSLQNFHYQVHREYSQTKLLDIKLILWSTTADLEDLRGWGLIWLFVYPT